MNRHKGEAELLAVLVIIFCVIVCLTLLAVDGWNKTLCDDFAKVRFHGTVYECKRTAPTK